MDSSLCIHQEAWEMVFLWKSDSLMFLPHSFNLFNLLIHSVLCSEPSAFNCFCLKVSYDVRKLSCDSSNKLTNIKTSDFKFIIVGTGEKSSLTEYSPDQVESLCQEDSFLENSREPISHKIGVLSLRCDTFKFLLCLDKGLIVCGDSKVLPSHPSLLL